MARKKKQVEQIGPETEEEVVPKKKKTTRKKAVKKETVVEELDPVKVEQAKRQKILDTLRKGECLVTFRKLDGTERVLRGTLKADMLPPRELVENKAHEPDSSLIDRTTCAVFDTEKKEWRAFRWDSLISFSKVK